MQEVISAVCRDKAKGIQTTFKNWLVQPTTEEVIQALESDPHLELYVFGRGGISCCSAKFYGSLEAAARAVKEEAMTAVSEKHPKWWLLVL